MLLADFSSVRQRVSCLAAASLLLLANAPASLGAAPPANAQTAPKPADKKLDAKPTPFTISENVVYGKGGDVDLKLDIAVPNGEGPYPLIVCIHGGGWQGGNRQAYRRLIEAAATKGYVSATISYRLTQPDASGKAKYPFPAQIHDCKAAIRFLRANAGKYKINPNKIGVTGGSAGGHLSLLVGLSGKLDGLEGNGGNPEVSSQVHCVVNYFGPTDMAAMYPAVPAGIQRLLKTFLNGGPDESAKLYRAASPVSYIGKGDPPVLTLHGDKDQIVPVSQAKSLDAAMKKAGVPHTLLVFPEQGHGFNGEYTIKGIIASFEFFDTHLKGKPAR